MMTKCKQMCRFYFPCKATSVKVSIETLWKVCRLNKICTHIVLRWMRQICQERKCTWISESSELLGNLFVTKHLKTFLISRLNASNVLWQSLKRGNWVTCSHTFLFLLSGVSHFFSQTSLSLKQPLKWKDNQLVLAVWID